MPKCAACGFENGPEYESVPVYITRGKRKGEFSHTEPRATHTPQWAELQVERNFGFELRGEESWSCYRRTARLYMCPQCNTVRAEV